MRRAPSGAARDAAGRRRSCRRAPTRMSDAAAEAAPSATGVAPAISSGPCSGGNGIIVRDPFCRRGSRRSRSPSPTSLQREDAEHDGDAGKQRHPVGLPDILPPGGDHRAPGRDLGAHADAEEGQARLGQHGVGEDERALHQDRRDEVAQHVARHDAPGRHAERARRLHIGQFADDQRRGAHDAREPRRIDDAERDDDRGQRRPQRRHERDGQQDVGERHHRVDDARDAACRACGRSRRRARASTPTSAGQHHHRRADEQRQPARIERAA